MADYDVIVIGAGLGGLSAGALLAKQGRKVLVLEQSERIGGCCSTFEKDGFCFDVGASIIEIIQPIERTIENLSKSVMPGLKDHIVTVDCATPLDFERRLLLPRGAIYSLQQDLPAQAVFRPAARSKHIAGLYLAGSSTHPGGGVPSTIASGQIAASLIDRYEKEA